MKTTLLLTVLLSFALQGCAPATKTVSPGEAAWVLTEAANTQASVSATEARAATQSIEATAVVNAQGTQSASDVLDAEAKNLNADARLKEEELAELKAINDHKEVLRKLEIVVALDTAKKLQDQKLANDAWWADFWQKVGSGAAFVFLVIAAFLIIYARDYFRLRKQMLKDERQAQKQLRQADVQISIADAQKAASEARVAEAAAVEALLRAERARYMAMGDNVLDVKGADPKWVLPPAPQGPHRPARMHGVVSETLDLESDNQKMAREFLELCVLNAGPGAMHVPSAKQLDVTPDWRNRRVNLIRFYLDTEVGRQEGDVGSGTTIRHGRTLHDLAELARVNALQLTLPKASKLRQALHNQPAPI